MAACIVPEIDFVNYHQIAHQTMALNHKYLIGIKTTNNRLKFIKNTFNNHNFIYTEDTKLPILFFLTIQRVISLSKNQKSEQWRW